MQSNNSIGLGPPGTSVPTVIILFVHIGFVGFDNIVYQG